MLMKLWSVALCSQATLFNTFDGSFGDVKQLYRSRDVLTPADMIKVMEESSSKSNSVESEHV